MQASGGRGFQTPSGRGGPFISNYMATSSAMMSTRPSTSSTSPGQQQHTSTNTFRNGPGAGHGSALGTSNGGSTAGGGGGGGGININSKSVVFSNKTSPMDPRSPTASTNPGAGRGVGGQGHPGVPLTLRGGAVGPRLRAEGLMVPPASDAATLRRQVAALQLDLEAHIDGEMRLQSINNELRERLELYMKQNHENVERAENELNTLHEDMEQTLELQRRLAQRAQALEKEKKDMEAVLTRAADSYETERAILNNRLAEMSVEVGDKANAEAKIAFLEAELSTSTNLKDKLEERLQIITDEVLFLKAKQEEYTEEMHNLSKKDEIEKKIRSMANFCILRRNFFYLKEAVRDICIGRAHNMKARKHYDSKLLFIGWRFFHLACGRSKLIKKKVIELNHRILVNCFFAWVKMVQTSIMHKRNQIRQIKERLQRVLYSWEEYSMLVQSKPRKNHVATQHYSLHARGKVFRSWKMVIKSWSLSKEVEEKLSLAAQIHYEVHCKRKIVHHWKNWLKYHVRPQRKKLLKIQTHINKMTMKQAISAWQCIMRIRWMTRIKYDEARNFEKRWIYLRTLSRFKDALRVINFERRIKIQASQFRKKRKAIEVVKRWRLLVQEKQNLRLYHQVALQFYANQLSKKSLRAWTNAITIFKTEKRAIREVNQCLTRAAMVLWRDYHVYHALKKKKSTKAKTFRKRKSLQMARNCLSNWWDLMAWKRRANQLNILMSQRLRRNLLQNSLHSWMNVTFDGLIVANAKFQDDLIQAQSQCKEQKHQVSTVDVENLQLIDRLHNMASEIAYLKTTINERSQEIHELHRAIEDAAMVESSMRDEIEQQQARIEDLQNANVILQRRIQTKNVEDTTGEVHHTLELQNMEHNLQQLHIQLAEQTSQLDSYEKALKETAEKLEGASDESQEKLTSAFEIAGSLRKLLEDREQQYACLEGSSRRRELELGEVQRKLAAANCTLCETVEVRDARIEELENILSRKQSEILDIQSHLQDLEVALDSKESHVRKLEYEIQLMSEPHAAKAYKFMSSMSSCAATPTRLRPHPNAHAQGGGPSSIPPQAQQASTSAAAAPPDSPHPNPMPLSRRPSHGGAIPAAMESSSRVPAAAIPVQASSSSLRESLQADTIKPTPALQSPPPHHADGTTELRSSPSEVQSPRELQMGSTSKVLHSSVRGLQRMAACLPMGNERIPQEMRGQEAGTRSDGFVVRVSDDQSVVDSLHFEIQRLQARIMSRLRDPVTPGSAAPGSSSQERLSDTGCEQRLMSGDPTTSASRGTSPGY